MKNNKIKEIDYCQFCGGKNMTLLKHSSCRDYPINYIFLCNHCLVRMYWNILNEKTRIKLKQDNINQNNGMRLLCEETDKNIKDHYKKREEKFEITMQEENEKKLLKKNRRKL